MKYSARLNKVNNINTFDDVILLFAQRFLNVYDIMEGEDWLHNFGDYIQNSDFPCNKININPFSGYSNRFDITLYYNDTKIAWLQIETLPYNIMKVHNYSYYKKDFEIFHNIITDYFKILNTEMWNTMLKTANITTDQNNSVEVLDHTDYKPNGNTQTLKGTIEQIFDTYTTHNDKLKYCNGMYWKFNDKNVSILYTMFINIYDGNYFLDNAVKRGVTID